MKELSERHFQSHISGNTLYTASCTDGWCVLIKEYAIFKLPLELLSSLAAFLVTLRPYV